MSARIIISKVSLATQHFIERGHRAIGILVVNPSESGASERLRGYRDAMSAAGLPIDPAWIQSTLQQKVYDTIGRWRLAA